MINASNALISYRDRAAAGLRLRPSHLVVLLLATPFVLLGASGWIEHLAFATPSMTKYVLTILAPMAAVAVVLAPQPFLVFTAVVVFAAPAAVLKVSFSGVSFDAMTVTTLLAAVPILLGLVPRVGRSALGRTVPFAVVLAAAGFAHGSQIGSVLMVAVMAGAVIYICARAARVPGGVAVVAGTLLAALFLQALLAIWEYSTRSEFDIYSGVASRSSDYFFDYQTQPRPTGTFYDPISLGTALAVAIPVGLVVIYVLIRRRNWLPAGAVTVAVGVIGVGLALTLSRMATLGALASVVVVVLLVPRRARLRMAQLVGGMLVVLLIAAMTVGGGSLVERISSISDPTASGVVTADGDRDRLGFWHVAVEAGLQHPVAGVGVGNLNAILVANAPDAGVYTHAHSAYLQIFSEDGILGLLALAVLLGGLLVDLRRAYRSSPLLVAGLAGAAAALAVAATTDVVIIRYEAVACSVAPIVGLIAGLAARSCDEQVDATWTYEEPFRD